MIRKVLSFLLVLTLVLNLALPAAASEMGQLEPYAVSLIQYYLHHREAAEDVIWDITRQMKDIDRKQGAVWEKIMFDWSWINSEMTVYENSLPDGLAQDDSLCIMVMGFGLKEDGSMREELKDRLVVALTSALKYPNAYILVTGGQTGAVDGVTEAGQMAAWLQSKGLSGDRIIQERQSLSTTANAVNCYKLLTKSYPQVTDVAIITSDYHIKDSCALFAAVSNYQSGYKGGRTLELVGNAVCNTGTRSDSLATQAWGMSLIMGLPYEDNTKAPKLYAVERPPDPVYEEPTQAAQAAAEAEAAPWPPVDGQAAALEEAERSMRINIRVLTAVAVVSLLAALWLMSPKRPRKKNRREKPKMNWDV